jgi:hypothetical protein
MGATAEHIGDFLTRPDITDEEKLVIRWQFRRCGDFEAALWNAIKRADETNLGRLALGFPQHVRGYQAWAFGDPYSMGAKLRGLGLDI